MPLETVTLTVSGANPQTRTVQINVNPTTGTGSGSILLAGANGGEDTLQATATIAGKNYTSNPAYLAWQATNGVVSLINPATLQGYENEAHETFYPIGASFFGPTGYDCIVVNEVDNGFPVSGIVSSDGNSGQYQHVPPMVDVCNPDGSAQNSNGSPLSSFSGVPFFAVWRGQFVVSQAGTQTFYFLVDDAWALYLGGGATRIQGTFNPNTSDQGGGTPTTFEGYPLIGTRNTAALAVTAQSTDYVYVSFPTPGVYPFRLLWKNGGNPITYLQPTFAAGAAAIPPTTAGALSPIGKLIKPITAQAAPPVTVPSGNLQLSVVNNPLQIVGGGSASLLVTVSGVTYSTVPYLPILEGTQGNVFIYNSGSTFTYPSYNGQAVSKAAAVTAGAISLSGDNSSWQGRLAVTYDGTNFNVKYNGNSFDASVAVTNLTVSADDVAWYNSTSQTFDLFSGTSGALQYEIPVNYMVKPTVASVTPSSLTANGSQQVLTISLNKPFSPAQQGSFNTGNTIITTASASGGVVVDTSPVPILNADGWLTGWNVTVTVPTSTSNGSFQLTMNCSGQLTYLNGSTIVTQSVTYFNTVVATVTTVGAQFAPPTNYAFSVSPSVLFGEISLSATVLSTDNGAMSLTFTGSSASFPSFTVGTGIKQSGPTAVSNGFLTVFGASADSTVGWGDPVHLGYKVTDALSGLSLTYVSPTQYVNDNANVPPTGCPAVEMWVNARQQVADCIPGTQLTALTGEADSYLNTLPPTTSAEVMQTDYSTEVCYRLQTANGAEVVVSNSTPVPTREALELLRQGYVSGSVPALADEVAVGMHVITDVGNGLEWSELIGVDCVGMRRVARLFCGGKNFAAGAVAGKYIYTHNTADIAIK